MNIIIVDINGNYNYYTGKLATDFRIESCKGMAPLAWSKPFPENGDFGDNKTTSDFVTNVRRVKDLYEMVKEGSRLVLSNNTIWYFKEPIGELDIENAKTLKFEGGIRYETIVYQEGE